MKQIMLSYKPGLIKGLRSAVQTARDSYALTTAIGVHPLEEGLTTAETFEELNLDSITCDFPYPQVFKLSGKTIVCTEDTIYEYLAGTPVSKLAGLTPGCLWTYADFNAYILLTNGKQLVKLDPVSGVWSVETTLPVGSCICSNGGQIILGGYNSTIPKPNIDQIDNTLNVDGITITAELEGDFA